MDVTERIPNTSEPPPKGYVECPVCGGKKCGVCGETGVVTIQRAVELEGVDEPAPDAYWDEQEQNWEKGLGIETRHQLY